MRRLLISSFLLLSSGSAWAQQELPPPTDAATADRHWIRDLPPQDEAAERSLVVAVQVPPQQTADPVDQQTDAPPPEEKPPAPAPPAPKKPNPAATAFKPLFYDNNFDYLCDDPQAPHYLGDCLKRRCLGCYTVIDLGGQFRVRLQNEQNLRLLGLTGIDDDFLLFRTRLYANWEIRPWARLYAEYLDAESNYEQFEPRPIEVNRSDILNLFLDLKLTERPQGDLWFRLGRQELLYGVQRVISPLDWANIRRTFDGAKVFWRGKKWNVDGFWTNPVSPNPERFDSPNRDQEFGGIWASYLGATDRQFDLYYLRYNNSSGANDYQLDSIGSRWYGQQESWLWELWGTVQFGRNTDGSDHSAGAVTVGLGHQWKRHCWKPTLWAYYDFASGANDLGAGNGYNHLFPLAHKFLGFMDLYGRRNIEDFNFTFAVHPRDKLTVLLWYHYMTLATGTDTPYNINMSPFNPANRPLSVKLGHEIDLLTTWQLTARQQILFGYSHFFSGDYYRLTPGVPYRGDADFFYTQYQIDF